MLTVTIILACCILLQHQPTAAYQVKSGPLIKYRPSWLKRCERYTHETNDCLTEMFAEMFPQLAKGIDEINVDAFEPLHLDKVSVSKGAGAVTLTGSFYNLTVVGPSNSTPTYSDLDIPNRKFNFGIYLPLLDIRAKYNLKGQLLILPLVGHGNCEMLLSGVDTKIKADISFPLVDGKEILKFDTMQLSFTIEKIKIRLGNLFNGNKVLGLTVNSFLNQHGVEIVNELEEPISESLAQIFKDIINNIFTKLPTEFWLPKTSDDAAGDDAAGDDAVANTTTTTTSTTSPQ